MAMAATRTACACSLNSADASTFAAAVPQGFRKREIHRLIAGGADRHESGMAQFLEQVQPVGMRSPAEFLPGARAAGSHIGAEGDRRQERAIQPLRLFEADRARRE